LGGGGEGGTPCRKHKVCLVRTVNHLCNFLFVSQVLGLQAFLAAKKQKGKFTLKEIWCTDIHIRNFFLMYD
jgi:hypothetical protein